VVLAMEPTFGITGTVRVPEGVMLAGARVIADPMEAGTPFGGGGSGEVKENAWKIDGVGPGKYRFFLSQLPEGTYLKTVSAQGQDISAGASVTAAASGIELILGTDAPELNGTVVNKDKDPAGGTTVVLVPDTDRERYWLFRTATADQNGAFAMKNIAPGQYTAYAFADVEDGIWMDADFLKRYEGKGVRLKLEEKSKETAPLTVAEQ